MLKKLTITTTAIMHLSLGGCYNNEDIRSRYPVNTELFCPEFSYRFLVLKTTQEEVLQAINEAIEYNRKSNKGSKYTVLRFPHNQSTSIYNVSPEELKRCGIRELPRASGDNK
jgi:uncharacterized lipoprotein NlpE involved in copper resistance